jgi:glutamate/tyrosine decarboxylase-like PLP-dependent enzyme
MQQPRGLDWDLPEFDRLLGRAKDLIIERYADMADASAFGGLTPGEVNRRFAEGLPAGPMDIDALLDRVKADILDTATLNLGPNMYAYVMTCGTQVSVLAEMLAAAINQNGAKWHLGPALSAVEQRVIQWGGAFIGFSDQAGGALVSGGSAASLTCLTIALNQALGADGARRGLFGLPPVTLYASTETHGCIDKCVEQMGIGTDNLRRIPVDPACHIRLDLLEARIREDLAAGLKPLCVIGNAGTVNTGAVDPLDELADIAARYGIWLHVDGAYGGMAAALASQRARFRGLERADSVALDFHKWLYQPYEAGCALFKGWDAARRTFQHQAAYLATDLTGDRRVDLPDYSFQLSRNFKALKVWMTFKAYGAERLRQEIEEDIRKARYLAQVIRATADFELLQEPELSIVCFRYQGRAAGNTAAVDQLNQALIPALEKDGRVFITGTRIQGRPVIRACFVNHRQQYGDIDRLVAVIREVGQSLSDSRSGL